jgi:pimeloyl-ACP methyl ester carboxylesterase
MLKIFKRLSLILFLIYLAIGILLYINQRDLLYHIAPNLATSHPTLTLENEGEKIRVLIVNKGQKNAILYFGGNGQSMVNSADVIAKRFPNFTLYLMEYRGYGASTGSPTESGIYLDALSLYDKVKPSHKMISVVGRSLGSGVATYVASKKEVDKLLLITPFDSILNVAQEQYPIYPLRFLLHDTYDSKSRVSLIQSSTLIVVAQHDTIILKVRSDALIHAFNSSQLQVKTIPNIGHNRITSDKQYDKTIKDFMSDK